MTFSPSEASAVSSGQDLLAYAIDTQGRRIHTTYLKNLATGAAA